MSNLADSNAFDLLAYFETIFQKQALQFNKDIFQLICQFSQSIEHIHHVIENSYGSLNTHRVSVRPRPKILVCRSFFIESCQKSFSRSGTQKIDNFGPFFENRSSKFLPSGKKRVFETLFFSKNRGKGGYFWWSAPKMFLQNWTNIARFQFKNERDRRRTRGVIRPSYQEFILPEHGTGSSVSAVVFLFSLSLASKRKEAKVFSFTILTDRYFSFENLIEFICCAKTSQGLLESLTLLAVFLAQEEENLLVKL